MLSCAYSAIAQDIKLPEPKQNRKTLTVSKALAQRHSVREFAKKDLSKQDLSDLCWAAFGMSRDEYHRTAPTAQNKQEIRVYVFDKKGVYEYMASSNLLKQVAKGDHRDLMSAGQKFAETAPVSLLLVIDFNIFGSDSQQALMMGCVDAGNVSENINLFCEAAGMVTVPRATMDTKGIVKLLKMNDKMLPIINNPVGYPVKK